MAIQLVLQHSRSRCYVIGRTSLVGGCGHPKSIVPTNSLALHQHTVCSPQIKRKRHQVVLENWAWNAENKNVTHLRIAFCELKDLSEPRPVVAGCFEIEECIVWDICIKICNLKGIERKWSWVHPFPSTFNLIIQLCLFRRSDLKLTAVYTNTKSFPLIAKQDKSWFGYPVKVLPIKFRLIDAVLP